MGDDAMAKFVFRFESLLRHRRHIEDARQRELAQHLRGRMILDGQLRSMQQSIRDSKHQLGASLVGRVNLGDIQQFARYSGHTTLRARQIVEKLAEVERQVESARAQLLEATRQRKALELLRDKHLAAWRKEQQRREDLELDEIATQAFAREALMGGAR
jgi:flagellar FliJ protein